MPSPTRTIAVGASETCTATHTFTQAELDQNGSPPPGNGNLFNNTTASANYTLSLHDALPIFTQSASMTVAKSSTTSSLSAPGPVNYSYLVTNTGNVTIARAYLCTPDTH